MPGQNELICLECGEYMRVEKNGVVVKLPNYSGYFRADVWVCPRCGRRILTGFVSEFFDYNGEVDIDLTDGGD